MTKRTVPSFSSLRRRRRESDGFLMCSRAKISQGPTSLTACQDSACALVASAESGLLRSPTTSGIFSSMARSKGGSSRRSCAQRAATVSGPQLRGFGKDDRRVVVADAAVQEAQHAHAIAVLDAEREQAAAGLPLAPNTVTNAGSIWLAAPIVSHQTSRMSAHWNAKQRASPRAPERGHQASKSRSERLTETRMISGTESPQSLAYGNR